MTVCQPVHERGAVAVIVAILLPALLGVAGLVIDGGELMLARLRLQTAADASALAATSFIGRSRSASPSPHREAWRSHLTRTAQTIARHNWRADAPLSLAVESGHWDAAARRLAPTPDQPDAVAVRLTTTVPTRLAGLFGFPRWTLSARSIAALPSLGSIPAGTVTIPLSLVRLPTGDGLPPLHTGLTHRISSCLARVSFDSSGRSPSASSGAEAPALSAGHSQIRVISTLAGGEVAALLNASQLRAAFSGNGVTAVVPVIESDRCPVSPGWYRVIGFATVRLSAGPPDYRGGFLPIVLPTPHGGGRSSLSVRLVTGAVTQGRGGGTDFGTQAAAPVLVH